MNRRAPLLAAGALLAGGAEIWLAHASSGPGGILERRYGLLGLIGIWVVAYAVAVLCALRLPPRWAIGLVLVLGLAMRLAAISPKAPLSDDLYRYAWDGVVQTHGIDPYRFAPTAPELIPLRDPWLWPAHGPRSGTQINRAGVRTIYPPVAEAWFTLEHLVTPLGARDRGYERVGLVLDLAVLAVLLALLRDRRWLALYALSPLPVLEAVQNAHVDTLAVLLALVAVVLAERRRPTSAVVVLALATLTKIYPVVLLPLLLRNRASRTRSGAVFAGVCALAYLPHVVAVGTNILGYLPGYLREERYGSGTRYLLLGLFGLRGIDATLLALVLLAALAVWALRTSLPLLPAATRLMTGVLLLVTPAQPWYALLLLALATSAVAWWTVPVTLASYPLFFALVLDGPSQLVGRLSWAVAAGLAAVGFQVSRRRRSG